VDFFANALLQGVAKAKQSANGYDKHHRRSTKSLNTAR